MSAISSLTSAAGAIPASAYANEPEAIRKGDNTAKQAYATGLGFEQMLLGQLTQQMTDTISQTGSDGDGLGGSGDSSDGSSSDPLSSAYSSLLPSALAQGVMAGGDNALAMQIAQGIDPALLRSPGSGSGGSR